MPSFEYESVVRGHHVYKAIWSPIVGEELEMCREPENRYDRHAVALKKRGSVVGHVPRENSKIMFEFMASGGRITCRVRKLGNGLEVPCVYVFSGNKTLLAKTKKSFRK